MKKSKAYWSPFPLTFFALLAFVLGVPGGAHSIAYAQSNIVGISVPLSGNAAGLGRQFVIGARLAIRSLAQSQSIELMISDDGCDKELARLAVEDITEAGARLITGFLCNEPVYTALKMQSGNQADNSVPLLIAGARSNRILADRARHGWNVWQSSPRDSDVSRAAFRELSKRWRSVPFAIVDDGTVYGRTQADEFRSLMEEGGNKPQFVDNFRPAQSTQAGLIRRLKKSGVEAVFLAAGADDVALIGRNMVEFGFSIEIATGEAASILPYVNDSDQIPNGLLALMPSPPEDLPRVQALISTLKQENLEPEPYLLLGYATMQIVSSYLSNAQTTFSGVTYQTVLGDIAFDETGRNVLSPYFLYRWDGEKFSRAQ